MEILKFPNFCDMVSFHDGFEPILCVVGSNCLSLWRRDLKCSSSNGNTHAFQNMNSLDGADYVKVRCFIQPVDHFITLDTFKVIHVVDAKRLVYFTW